MADDCKGIAWRPALHNMKKVLVVPPDPQWPIAFGEIREVLWPAVSNVVLRIEHVGSTAVPGLAAKPVIDIDLVVADEASIEILAAQLAPLGYEARGTLGVPGRWAFRQHNALPRHHLYACPQHSEGLQNHLTFRDFLRTHSTVAQTYGELKVRLARQFADDIDRYIDGKTSFIADVLERCGVPSDQLASIVAANRLAG
jgi:GrpB-like predicted nucleotidyltransferase (UPF0157 family)